jgi:hypothetical protein
MQYQALCRDEAKTRLANLPVEVKGLVNLEFWVQNLKGTGWITPSSNGGAEVFCRALIA